MVKSVRAVYTLNKPYFFATLYEINEAVRQMGFELILVGGGAVQAHIANILGLEEASKHLRKTDDIDMVLLGMSKENIIHLLKTIDGTSKLYSNGKEEHLLEIHISRLGEKKPILHVKHLNSDLFEGDIMLNISTTLNELRNFEPETVEKFYKRAVELSISHKELGLKLLVKVLALEDLITTKLVAGRDKDVKDVKSLLEILASKRREINWKVVEENIKEVKNMEKRSNARERLKEVKLHFKIKNT